MSNLQVPYNSSDGGNDPRGFITQMLNSGGWKSLPVGTPVQLTGGYGNQTAHFMSRQEYEALGPIPGAVIMTTEHSDPNGTSWESRGYDIGTVRPNGTVVNF